MPGCEWRVIAKDKNKYIVNIVNIGKSDATVSMSAAKGNIKSVSEVLTGLKSATKIVLKPNDVQLLEVSLEWEHSLFLFITIKIFSFVIK